MTDERYGLVILLDDDHVERVTLERHMVECEIPLRECPESVLVSHGFYNTLTQ